jgi:tRNA-splicing endonuclease subunit Sen54
MHNALAFQRIHQPKHHTVATYHPESNMAYAYNPKGPLFTRMGQTMPLNGDPLGNERRGHRLWLLPEEALYLLERGTIDIRWPATEEEEAAGEMGLPMSLQGGHAVFIGDEATHGGALTYERYSVFSALKRQGYTVLRAPSWNGPGLPLNEKHYPSRTSDVGLLHPSRLWKALFAGNATTNNNNGVSSDEDSLVSPGLYRSYNDIYRRLALIDFHDSSAARQPTSPETPDTEPAFRITYHVYKPGSTTYKKSDPGPPDFRLAVVNGRETPVPTLEQLSSLLETTPYDPPLEHVQLYGKLRWGYKNVVLAIVDQGVTSYLRIGDSVFGKERIYERASKGPGAKRGGRGGGRGGRGGRGGGRGRGK